MTLETFRAALKLSADLESDARLFGYNYILLSGGECTDHPQFEEFVYEAAGVGYGVFALTHGGWLLDEVRRKRILALPLHTIQVTNVKAFYPRAVPADVANLDPRIVFVDQLQALIPLGRAAKRVDALSDASGVRKLKAPQSYNFRAMARASGLRDAVTLLRERARMGLNGNCTPSISVTGDFVAGETRFCFSIGTVFDSVEVLDARARSTFSCDRCGLESKLPNLFREQLGLAPLEQTA